MEIICSALSLRIESDFCDYVIVHELLHMKVPNHGKLFKSLMFAFLPDWDRSWARLIRKIYDVEPLICPRCGGDMRIIAFIEDYKVVKKILDYLKVYEFKKKRPPPKIHTCCDDYIDLEYSDF